MWDEFLIHSFLGLLTVVIKNPEKKAKLCALLLHARDTITEIYPDGCPK